MIQRAPIFSRSLHSSNFIRGISILFLSSGRRRIFWFASEDERAGKEGTGRSRGSRGGRAAKGAEGQREREGAEGAERAERQRSKRGQKGKGVQIGNDPLGLCVWKRPLKICGEGLWVAIRTASCQMIEWKWWRYGGKWWRYGGKWWRYGWKWWRYGGKWWRYGGKRIKEKEQRKLVSKEWNSSTRFSSTTFMKNKIHWLPNIPPVVEWRGVYFFGKEGFGHMVMCSV